MKTLNLNADVIGKKEPVPFEGENKTGTLPAAPSIEKAAAQPSCSPKAPTKPSNIKNFFKSIASYPKRFFAWFQNLPTGKKILFTGSTCAVIAGIGGILIYSLVILEGKTSIHTIPTRIPASQSSESAYQTQIPLSFPSEPRTTPDPINGELYTKAEYEAFSSKYPIAVMIENHVDARNQSGYNSADIVFEALAEGGITRTMAIFWGKSVESIGPIRSARVYYIEWLAPFDPLYMHIGYALSDDPRTDAGGLIYKLGIKSLDRGGTFWRVTDKYAPHNAYSSTELLYEMAERYGYSGSPSEIESLSFKRDDQLDKRGQKTTAALIFFERLNNGGLYDVTWEYDRESNTYLRYNNTTPYIDMNTGTQVYAKNVIIQRVETISAFDEKAHMIITTIGSGDAIILRDGKVIHGTWEKEDVTSRTRYFTSDGEEIELNRGIIWVEAVPIDQGTVQIDS